MACLIVMIDMIDMMQTSNVDTFFHLVPRRKMYQMADQVFHLSHCKNYSTAVNSIWYHTIKSGAEFLLATDYLETSD